MALIHKSNGEGGQEEGTFLKLNWGVLLGILVTISIAVFGIVNASNSTAHDKLDSRIEKMVASITTLSSTVNSNCSDIAVLKESTSTTKSALSNIDRKLDSIRRDQVDYNKSRGFSPKVTK